MSRDDNRVSRISLRRSDDDFSQGQRRVDFEDDVTVVIGMGIRGDRFLGRCVFIPEHQKEKDNQQLGHQTLSNAEIHGLVRQRTQAVSQRPGTRA